MQAGQVAIVPRWGDQFSYILLGYAYNWWFISVIDTNHVYRRIKAPPQKPVCISSWAFQSPEGWADLRCVFCKERRLPWVFNQALAPLDFEQESSKMDVDLWLKLRSDNSDRATTRNEMDAAYSECDTISISQPDITLASHRRMRSSLYLYFR